MLDYTKRVAALRLAGFASVSALALTGSIALAQDASEAEESAQDDMPRSGNAIIVTARTFEEDLQDVPIAVSALTAETLQRRAADDLGDIADNIVGFAFEEFTGLLAQPTIRGQTNLRVTSPVQNVATYLDGVYIQRQYLIDQGLLALDRVEVIKGPQSALYGRNSFAGVINLVSRKPDLDEFTGAVRAGIGTDEFYEASGTLSVPIIPGAFAIMGHVAYQEFDGTIENSHPLADAEGCITCGNLQGYERETYQVTALAKLTDSLTVQATYIHTERFQEHVANFSFGTSGLTDPYNYNNCSPVAGQNRLYCGELPNDPNFVTGAATNPGGTLGPDPRPDGFLIDPRGFGLDGPTDVITAKVDFAPTDDLSLTYQFGYTFGNVDARGSTARNPLQPLVLFGQNFGTLFDSSGTGSEFESFSHDLRVTYESESLYAFIGANYSTTSDIESNASETYPVGTNQVPNLDQVIFPVGPGLPFPTAFFQRRTFLERDEDILSIYAFAEFQASDQLRFSVEGRYTIEDRTTIDRLTREPTNPAIQAFNPPRDDVTEEFFTPRFSATYEFTPDNLLYASVARGVKAGGSNGFVPFEPQQQYLRETNWTYEIGSKNYFPAIGLTLNAAVFYTDWEDLQTTEARRLADGTVPVTFAVLSTVTGNVGSVEVYGAEVEGVFELTPNITLDFGAAYNDARYIEGSTSQRFELSGNCDGVVCPTGPVPIGGNQLERTPAFDAYAGLGYRGDIGENSDFYVRVDASYQTKQFVDEANLAWVPDRFLMNAQAGVNFGNFSVQAVVQNALDEIYVSNSLFLIGTGGALSSSYVPIFGLGRTARISVGYEF
ncbi:MAG: TonB-dependent receptor [Erythrobacter sp.]|jgi:iron complex outermembrane receptor protein|nr:TonB-dependent receptor [Erythrobacter sp.]